MEESQWVDGNASRQDVTVFCCQRCRCVLFSKEQLSSQHDEGRHQFAYRRQRKEANQAQVAAPADHQAPNGEAREGEEEDEESGGGTVNKCTSWFVSEPNAWMSRCTSGDDTSTGKLVCPSCTNRVGSFSWSGSQCSCGTWIVPAFQFPKSKLDTRIRAMDSIPADAQSPTITAAPEPFEEALENFQISDEGTSESRGSEIQELRKAKHREWLDHTNVGDGEAYWRSALYQGGGEECSLTTIQKKSFDGVAQVSDMLSKSSAKLAGRITVLQGPKALAAPSTSTRVLFSVEGIEGVMGETLVWSSEEDCKVHHVIRVRNPFEDMYMSDTV